MPYADNEGIRIHYKTEGEGSPLVLQHASLATRKNWYDYGYVSALKNDYRVILLDGRGHGGSDKPHSPDAYELEKRVVTSSQFWMTWASRKPITLDTRWAGGSGSAWRTTLLNVSN